MSVQEKDQPDPYSNAWYREQFRGLTHGFNRCLAEHKDCWEAVKKLRERTEMLVTALNDAQIEIGRQTDEIAELKESMEKAREVFRGLKEASKTQKGT